MDKKKRTIVTIILLMSLILITVGISYAFFTYVGIGSKENTIKTGNLTFVYDEQNKQGNGINLTNAFPISDIEGKTLVGNNNVFDFQVLATTTGSAISYEVIGEKKENSTLADNMVKVYLTSLSGNQETEITTTVKDGVVTSYSELVDTTIKDQTGKTLYQEIISEGQTNYNKQFRLRMWLSEEASNVTEGEWEYNNKEFSLGVNVVANGEAINTPIEQKPNTPEIIEGLIPVVYNESTNNWVKADTTNNWYDYESQKWANAVTVTETNRASYMNANPGTTIASEDINTMWVWIPRYEYQYTDLGTSYAGGSKEQPGEIKIKFISKTTTTPSSSEYKVHPAFTFGDEELGGFWYGKFETSSSNPAIGENYGGGNTFALDPYVKPNVTSWRNININNQINVSKKLTAIGNIYGLSSNADSHVSKNSEWGAVAYLSQSKYGKYGNSNFSGAHKGIYMNNYGEMTYYTTLTGCSAGVLTASTSGTCAHTYEVPLSGTGASTTGTIYGIYDMSGGSWEYVMGNYNNEVGSSGFSSMPESKYYDVYTSSNPSSIDGALSQTACNGGVCYGHSLSETAGWYNDYQRMVNTNNPWFLRGGRFTDGLWAGVFTFYGINGDTYPSYSFRLVLAPSA